MRYTVHLDQPQTQTFGMTLEIDRPGEDLLVALPTWRPGRYSILDPAGTLRDVRAVDVAGEPLELRKVDKSSWRVATDGVESVRIHYTVYANSLRDRTRHVDDTHAFLSPSSVFLYAPSLRDQALEVTLEAPEDWRVAGGLEAVPGSPRRLRAANYDVLADSPIEVGLNDQLDFEVEGKRHEIVLWPPGAHFDADNLIDDSRAIVEEQLAIFGRLPYDRYVFLVHVGAGAGGGTEHINSTIMQTSLEAIEGSRMRTDPYERYLGLVSHEFFHTWNVKQLRPAGIAPYDYQGENYSTLFWVAEGTTSYYDDLTLVRAELIDADDYLETIGESIDSLRNRPGASVQSLADSSYDAWIKFNRRTPDDVNSTVSFYSKGALVSLLLDLRIREATGNRGSLDQVMRRMFEKYPLEDGGYTEADLRAEVESVAGSSFEEFFADFVHGTAPLTLEESLRFAGVELYLKPKKASGNGGPDDDDADDDDADDDDAEDDDAGEAEGADGERGERAASEEPETVAFLGADLRDDSGHTVVSRVLADGPAYLAGLQSGDEIVALDGRRLEADSLERRLEVFGPGDRVRLHLLRHDRLRELEVTLAGRPRAEWRLRRVEDASAEQRGVYEDWLGWEWPDDADDDEPEADGG